MQCRLTSLCLSLTVLLSLPTQAASPAKIEYVTNPLEDAFYNCDLWGETGRAIAVARDANKSRSTATQELMSSPLLKAGKAYDDQRKLTSPESGDGPHDMTAFADKLTELVYYRVPVLTPPNAAALLYSACYGGKPFKTRKR